MSANPVSGPGARLILGEFSQIGYDENPEGTLAF